MNTRISVAPVGGRPSTGPRWTWLTVPIDDPGDLLERLPVPTASAWVRDGYGLIGWGEVARIRPGGSDRFRVAGASLRHLVADGDVHDEVSAAGTGPVAFGAFTFSPDAPASVLVVPEVTVGRSPWGAWLTVAAHTGWPPDAALDRALDQLRHPRPVAPTGAVRWSSGALSADGWLDAVREVLAQIDRGDVEKVVLSRYLRGSAAAEVDPRGLLRRLGQAYPQCYAYACAGLVGATPELLVRRRADLVESLVLAGSSVRSADPVRDGELRAALRDSAKDHAEHRFAVDSVAATLGPLCDDLRVPAEPGLLVLANIVHLATAVTGRLRQPGISALHLASMLHPTAAVCGIPSAAAMRLIQRLERVDRGRYTGPVGWIGANGDGDWGIALRCAQIEGRDLRVSAGAGIVAGSRPPDELVETEVKLSAVLDALAVADPVAPLHPVLGAR